MVIPLPPSPSPPRGVGGGRPPPSERPRLACGLPEAEGGSSSATRGPQTLWDSAFPTGGLVSGLPEPAHRGDSRWHRARGALPATWPPRQGRWHRRTAAPRPLLGQPAAKRAARQADGGRLMVRDVPSSVRALGTVGEPTAVPRPPARLRGARGRPGWAQCPG